jgi:hypothetical protein
MAQSLIHSDFEMAVVAEVIGDHFLKQLETYIHDSKMQFVKT